MTPEEQRERLVEAMAKGVRRRVEERMKVPLSPYESALHWYELDNMRAALIAISAAGFSIVGPEATDELINRIANAIALTAGDPWFDYRPHAKAVLGCLQEQGE